MFNNVGDKIKVTAKWFGVVSLIGGIITAVIYLFMGFADVWDYGFYLMIAALSLAGGFLLFAISRLYYGFGIIVDKFETDQYSNWIQKVEENSNANTENDASYTVFNRTEQMVFKICPRCGTKLHEKAGRCAKCGKEL